MEERIENLELELRLTIDRLDKAIGRLKALVSDLYYTKDQISSLEYKLGNEVRKLEGKIEDVKRYGYR
jgi:hypothetical protein